MMVDNNDNSSSGNKGNKGKFSERLRKIRIDRLRWKKKGNFNDEEESSFITFGRNFIKIALSLPSVVYSNLIEKEKKENFKKNNNIHIDEEINNIEEFEIVEERNNESRKIKVSKIKDIDVSLLKKKRDYYLKKRDYVNVNKVDIITNEISLELKKEKLQKEIINLIKKKLVKNINEFEILQSELYILNEMNLGDIYLNECIQDIKEVKKLLSKVKSLKEKYDYLKENVDFECMLEYGDDLLIDKILELKEICSRSDIKQTIDDYKILDEYKFLYLKIDKLQDEMLKLEEYKSKKVEELKERDVSFDSFKNDIYDLDMENERYNRFVKNQELFLKELDEKISHIDSYEQVNYRFKGFNQLLGNAFKYLGLLLVNPLKGLIPGIATQTLITRNLVHNLYNNLELEEERKMVYNGIDYSTSIKSAMSNLDDMSSLIDSTLEDIVLLKSKYKQEFSKYDSSFSSYRDAIKKLNKIENAVIGTKIKVESMQVKMKENEKKNDNKLKMIKKLNTVK